MRMQILQKSNDQSKLSQLYYPSSQNENLRFLLHQFHELIAIAPVSIKITQDGGALYKHIPREICISNSLPDVDKIICLAHEFGHAVCFDYGIIDTYVPIQTIEILCDKIAGWLLGAINFAPPYQLTSTFYYRQGYWDDSEHPRGHYRMQYFLNGYFAGKNGEDLIL